MTQDAKLDAKGLKAATAAVSAEIDRYWNDDTVEAGHEPVAAAAISAYLSALQDGEATEGEVDRIAECMWQAEWKRGGNGGLRRIPWSELAPIDQERFRFVAREVAALTRNAEPVVASEPFGAAALIRWAHDTLYEINPADYDDAEVRKLNDASVEVILGLAQFLGEKHGKTEAWWAEYRSKHPVPSATPPVAPTGTVGTPFGLSAEQIETLRSNGLKPEEIAGDQRVQAQRVGELLHWFDRLSRDSANPKWTRSHAFELAYYIATTDSRAPFDIGAVERAAWLKGLQEPPEIRDMAVRHGWIPAALSVAKLDPRLLDRIRELSTPPRDDHDRAVLMLVEAYENQVQP